MTAAEWLIRLVHPAGEHYQPSVTIEGVAIRQGIHEPIIKRAITAKTPAQINDQCWFVPGLGLCHCRLRHIREGLVVTVTYLRKLQIGRALQFLDTKMAIEGLHPEGLLFCRGLPLMLPYGPAIRGENPVIHHANIQSRKISGEALSVAE
jgi:hypothetical protein